MIGYLEQRSGEFDLFEARVCIAAVIVRDPPGCILINLSFSVCLKLGL